MDDQRPYAVVALMQCDAVASAGFVNECGEDLGRQPRGRTLVKVKGSKTAAKRCYLRLMYATD